MERRVYVPGLKVRRIFFTFFKTNELQVPSLHIIFVFQSEISLHCGSMSNTVKCKFLIVLHLFFKVLKTVKGITKFPEYACGRIRYFLCYIYHVLGFFLGFEIEFLESIDMGIRVGKE